MGCFINRSWSRDGQGGATVNLFAELVHSVYDFKSYPGYRKNKGGKVFLYGLLLSAVYFLISVLLPVVVSIAGFGGFLNMAREAIPDFTLEDGRLWVAEPVDIQQYDSYQGGICFRVDTDHPITEEITDVDLLAFDQVLVLDAEHGIVKAEGGSVIRFSYSDFDLGDWDRESFLEELVPLIPVFLWVMLVIVVCFGLFGFFAGAFVTAVTGSILSAVTGCRLKFGELYKLAIYARTPAMVVKSVYSWVPIVIPYFYVINFGVSAFYMWKAMQHIKEEMQNSTQSYWTGEP